MNNELAKTVSTCAIWVSLACILTFGIFKMNANGELVVILVVFCLPVMIAGCAVKATAVIWQAPPSQPPANRPPVPPGAATGSEN